MILEIKEYYLHWSIISYFVIFEFLWMNQYKTTLAGAYILVASIFTFPEYLSN